MSASPARDALRFLDEHRDCMIAFLRALIATPSVTMEMGERAIADAVVAETRALGLSDPEAHRAREEHPNLLYRLPGARPGPTLILNGHLDTQPPGDRSAWRHDPFAAHVEEDRLYGLGASDMKGAVAAQVYALAALAHAGAPGRGAVVLALVADEEAGGAHGADWLLRGGHLSGDACVVGEPAGIRTEWEAIYSGQCGQSGLWVHVRGDQMHSGVARDLGASNAAVAMARVMTALDRDLVIAASGNGERAPATVGVLIRCGEAWGTCPGSAEFGIDVRPRPGMTRDDVTHGVEAALDRLRATSPELDVSWRFAAPPQDWIAPTAAAPQSAIVGAARAATVAVLGHAPPLGVYPATTDAGAFMTRGGIPTIAALGPGRIALAHRPNEYVTLSSAVDAARLYVYLALTYLNGHARSVVGQ